MEGSNMKNLTYKKLFKLSAVTLSAISALSLCACGRGTAYYGKNGVQAAAAPSSMESNAGAGYYDEPSYYDDYDYYDYEAAAEEDYGYTTNVNGGGDAGLTSTQIEASVAANRKLIKTVNMSIETIAFNEFINNLQNEVNKCGGYIEYEYSYNGSAYNQDNFTNKNATYTIRIPDSKLDSFVGAVSGLASVTDKTTSTEDITLNYVDTESKKEMYEAEQESLMALLEKAESIEDITYLTQRLTEIRYNIESMESKLRVYDDLTDYATVNINVTEVKVLTPTVVEEKTLSQEMKEGFEQSVGDVINGIKHSFARFVIRLPYLIRTLVILAIIGGIIFAIVRIIIAIVKKQNKKYRDAYEAKKKEIEEEKKKAEGKKAEEKKAEEAKKVEEKKD
jgi:hypothetical protein